jgi:signal transduction histidine kinase
LSTELVEEITEILRAYSEEGGEGERYRASRLGTRLYKRGYAPDSVVGFFIEAVNKIEKTRVLDKESINLLLEMIMTYSVGFTRAHEKIENLNQILNTNRKINQIILRSDNIPKLLKDIPQIISDIRGFDHVWIIRFDENNNIVEYYSSKERDTLTGKNSKENNLPLCLRLGSEGSGIHRFNGRLDDCADCQIVSDHKDDKIIFTKIGYSEKFYGILGMSFENQIFEEDEKSFLEDITNDIAYGLYKIDLEKELKNYTENLEKLVEERTLELEKINEELIKLNKMKDRFLSMATHELRTPLVSIKGYVDYIQNGSAGRVPKRIKDLLDIVQRNTERLQGLTDDLLNQQRITSGKMKINKEPMELEEVIDNVIEEMIPLFDHKRQKLEVNKTAELPIINADRTRISEVLVNLLNNAWKFSSADTRIVLTFKETEDVIKVSVEDEGIGLSDEDKGKLFEPFPQIDRPTVTEKSTGLGLSISKGIVEMHGGEIWAESEGRGEGSTFIFTITKNEEDNR